MESGGSWSEQIAAQLSAGELEQEAACKTSGGGGRTAPCPHVAGQAGAPRRLRNSAGI